MNKQCKNCFYFYRTMACGNGYNPYPYCHLREETGKQPFPLTKECFKRKKK